MPAVVKSLSTGRTATDMFAFLMEAKNWPRWAIQGVKSVQPGSGGFWDVETPEGPARFKLEGHGASGIIDITFIHGKRYSLTIPGRVVDIGGGSVFVMVFAKPPVMSDEQFKQSMKQVDEELSLLKRILEQA